MESEQFRNAFTAQSIKFRAEKDGTIITNCPICEFEGKGESKAKIFADGNYVRLRYSGTGDYDHRREMLSAWNIVQSAKSSSFYLRNYFRR